MMLKIKNDSAKAKRLTPAQQSREDIDDFHKLGSEVLERASKHGITPAAAARDLVEAKGGSLDKAQRAVQFCKLYPKGPPEWLYDLCKFSGKRPLSVGHLLAMLKFKKDSDWKKWLERAVHNGWSHKALQQAINTARDTGLIHSGGPHIKAPKDLANLLNQVITLTDDWLKRYDDIWSRNEFWPPEIGTGRTKPEVLLKRFEKALEKVTLLRSGAETVETRLGNAKATAE
jgi:hypothetical protein